MSAQSPTTPKSLIASLSNKESIGSPLSSPSLISQTPKNELIPPTAVKSKRAKPPSSIETLVPSTPKDPSAREPRLIDMASRIDRLSEFIRPQRGPSEISMFSDDTPIDWLNLRRLLRIENAHLNMEDIEQITSNLSESYKQVDKVWISRVCTMVGQARSHQQQMVCIARTLQNIFSSQSSGIQFLENMSKCAFVEEDPEFGLPLKMIDIDEKTAVVLEHEKLILNVADMAEKISNMKPPEDLIAALERRKLNGSDQFDGISTKVGELEQRLEKFVEKATAFESKLMAIVRTIIQANEIYAGIRQLELASASPPPAS